MLNGAPTGTLPDASGEVLLSLQLRTPERIRVPEPDAPKAGDGVILHLEIRNRTDRTWEATSRVGPLLEIVLLDQEGGDLPLLLRQLPMLAYPAVFAPGRGFLLPVRVVFPEVPAEGATFRLRVRLSPGADETIGAVRFEPRGRN